MFYEERFKEWSRINYNDLILDDYILFGHGSYRSKRFVSTLKLEEKNLLLRTMTRLVHLKFESLLLVIII